MPGGGCVTTRARSSRVDEGRTIDPSSGRDPRSTPRDAGQPVPVIQPSSPVGDRHVHVPGGSSGYDTPAMTSLATPYRTHTCGALRASDAGATASLAGWVHRRRDHGQLIFLDLRDRHGITQVVIDAADAPDAHEVASRVRSEFVVRSRAVARRLPGHGEHALATGAIELRATDVTILSEAKTPPFYINDPDAPVDESLRLQYRYLDIRREPMQRACCCAPGWSRRSARRTTRTGSSRSRHRRSSRARRRARATSSSPPASSRAGLRAAAEPPAAQAAPHGRGIDRYFQIARCYRDEDLRGDRQPEFTQLDLEMSFVDEATVMASSSDGASRSRRATSPDRPIHQVPFPRFTYDEVIERFGSDKPDVRFGMELVDLAPALVDADGRAGLRLPRVR
jgi:aspartyl-tRNA synthetase